MSKPFAPYRRRQIAKLRPYIPGEQMGGISISPEDTKAGSPKPGDMIARNPANHSDQWLVAGSVFRRQLRADGLTLFARTTTDRA